MPKDDYQRQVLMFQFLIGKVTTYFAEWVYFDFPVEFQFLIGKVTTDYRHEGSRGYFDVSIPYRQSDDFVLRQFPRDQYKFQFLIGKVTTPEYFGIKEEQLKVSIPYRQSDDSWALPSRTLFALVVSIPYRQSDDGEIDSESMVVEGLFQFLIGKVTTLLAGATTTSRCIGFNSL